MKYFLMCFLFFCTHSFAQTIVDAQVISVTPVYIRGSRISEECYQERVPVPVLTYRGHNGVPGAIIGGVLGSAIYNDHRRTGAAVGALGGYLIGRQSSRYRYNYYPYQSYEVIERCRPIQRPYDFIDYYNVTYSYNEQVFVTRTQEHPGSVIRLHVSHIPVE